MGKNPLYRSLGRGSNYDLHIKIYKYFIFVPCQGSLETVNKGNQSQIIMRKKCAKNVIFLLHD